MHYCSFLLLLDKTNLNLFDQIKFRLYKYIEFPSNHDLVRSYICIYFLLLNDLDCPGTESEDAGKVDACQGCPNQTICASAQPQAPDPGMVDMSQD